uniref:Presenilin n=1 Tax=Strongyloides papillosus TaxID=174720 RepID=A0A0N5B9J8_STREA
MTNDIIESNSNVVKNHEVRYKVICDILEKSFRPPIKMFLPVFLNMIITLVLWIGLYDMKQEKNNPFNLKMLSSTSDFTTGNQFYDGIINALCLIFLIGLVSFGLLTLAIYEFKTVIQGWLSFSLISVLFGVFSIYVQDFLKLYDVPYQILLTISISLVYGIVGCFVFFTKKTPLIFHQIYTIINCSMVSVLYLRSFPESTIWYVLPTTIIWDIFAVWSPSGPLKRVTEKAYQYNESILKFMMFTADNTNEDGQIEDNEEDSFTSSSSAIDGGDEESLTNEDEDNDSIGTVNENSIDDLTETTENSNINLNDKEHAEYYEYLLKNKKKKENIITAMDALNDGNSVRLGLGDFIFYSLLVGKSAVDMSIMATISSIFAILFGLLITLVFLQKGDIVVPALPIPIFLGIIFHFGTLYLVEPFINQVYKHYVYLL